jgi:hypothetical protein
MTQGEPGQLPREGEPKPRPPRGGCKVSPRWESPFVYSRVVEYLEKSPYFRGESFFPWKTPYPSLRDDCPPIEDQGNFPTCTAHVVVGVLELLQKRLSNRPFRDLSRGFLHRRTADRSEGILACDAELTLERVFDTLKVLGVPFESAWPYQDPCGDKPSNIEIWTMLWKYTCGGSYRLDSDEYADPNPPQSRPGIIKRHIDNGQPVTVVIPSYSGSPLDAVGATGYVPMPAGPPTPPIDYMHSLLIIGYDDLRGPNGRDGTGAFEIRNSFGTSWGDSGYGWLPYGYVTGNLAEDFWSVLPEEFVASNLFNRF